MRGMRGLPWQVDLVGLVNNDKSRWLLRDGRIQLTNVVMGLCLIIHLFRWHHGSKQGLTKRNKATIWYFDKLENEHNLHMSYGLSWYVIYCIPPKVWFGESFRPCHNFWVRKTVCLSSRVLLLLNWSTYFGTFCVNWNTSLHKIYFILRRQYF